MWRAQGWFKALPPFCPSSTPNFKDPLSPPHVLLVGSRQFRASAPAGGSCYDNLSKRIHLPPSTRPFLRVLPGRTSPSLTHVAPLPPLSHAWVQPLSSPLPPRWPLWPSYPSPALPVASYRHVYVSNAKICPSVSVCVTSSVSSAPSSHFLPP